MGVIGVIGVVGVSVVVLVVLSSMAYRWIRVSFSSTFVIHLKCDHLSFTITSDSLAILSSYIKNCSYVGKKPMIAPSMTGDLCYGCVTEGDYHTAITSSYYIINIFK